MRSVYKTLLILPLAIILAMGALPVVSKAMTKQEMELVRAKVRADKKLFISNNMRLTQSESVAFWPIYDRYQKELDHIVDGILALIEDYARNYETMTDRKAKEIVDTFLAIETDRLKARRAFLPEFRQVLSDKKVARYYQLENKIRSVAMFELAARIPFVK